MNGRDVKRTEYVEQRLQEWRYYYSRMQDGALGYPSKDILAAWREGYTIKNKQKGSKIGSVEVNESAEEVEQIVNEMAKYDERFALALRCHYFSHEKNLRKQAEKLNISHTLFRIYIMAAKTWVASRLSGSL